MGREAAGPEVFEADEPEATIGVCDGSGAIAQQRDLARGQRGLEGIGDARGDAGVGAADVVIVVAERGDDGYARLGGNAREQIADGDDPIERVVDEVAGDDNEIGFGFDDAIDDAAEIAHRDIGASVEIGELGDAEAVEGFGEVADWHGNIVPVDPEGFDLGAVGAGGKGERGGGDQAAEKFAAGDFFGGGGGGWERCGRGRIRRHIFFGWGIGAGIGHL